MCVWSKLFTSQRLLLSVVAFWGAHVPFSLLRGAYRFSVFHALDHECTHTVNTYNNNRADCLQFQFPSISQFQPPFLEKSFKAASLSSCNLRESSLPRTFSSSFFRL